MPLPDGQVHLQPASRPGDAVHTKPKKAIIVRLSAETLDALESYPQNPKMSIVFGDKPSLWIGDQSFPMGAHREGGNHDLYLRSYTAQKPRAPLKFYAGVAGKFIVERTLEDKASDKVRERTKEVERQRQERKTVMVDFQDPQVSKGSGKGSKSQTQAKRKVLATSQVPRQISASTVHKPSPSPIKRQDVTDDSAPDSIKENMIHFLAQAPRSAPEVIDFIAGQACDAVARKTVMSCLREVGEDTELTADGSRKWSLKPGSWVYVRPFQHDGLSEEARTKIARAGRVKLRDLNIPQTEAVWQNFWDPKKEKDSATPDTLSAKRGISGSELREKKIAKEKAKAKAKGEIMMKNESVASTSKLEKHSPPAPSTASISTATKSSSTAARIPKKPKPEPQEADIRDEYTPTPPSTVKRKGPVDARGAKRELPPPSLPAKPAPPIAAPPRSDAPQRPLKRPGQLPAPTDKEKVRRPSEDAVKPLTSKRSPTNHDDRKEDLARKRHKMDNSTAAATAAAINRAYSGSSSGPPPSKPARDLSLPKKPVITSASKETTRLATVKKEPSPLPPPPARHSPSVSKTSSKKRERRPTPTWSSDESGEESERPIKRAKAVGSSKPSASAKSTLAKRVPSPLRRGHTRSSSDSQTDREALRAQYRRKYTGYITDYSRMAAQKQLLEDMLDGRLSGDDVDVMDTDELKSLRASFEKKESELRLIRSAFA